MADYYPLIAKAVAGLEKNTGEARRALYERARTALVTQLRGVSPALSESDITRERLALEESIRKIEAESARRARVEPAAPRADKPGPSPPKPAPSPPPKAEPAAPAAEPPAAPASKGEVKPPETPQPAANESGQRPPASRRGPSDRPSLSDQGLKGFRDVVAEAETLGEATAQASKSAREAFASVPAPGSDGQRIEPHIEPEGLRPPPRRPASLKPPGQQAPPPRGPVSREALSEPVRATAFDLDSLPRAEARGPRDNRREEWEDEASAHERPFPLPRGEGARGRREELEEDEETAPPPRLRSYRRVLTIAALLLLVAGLGGVTYWQWPRLAALIGSGMSLVGTPSTPTSREATPSSRPKISDRIGSPRDATRRSEEAAVAQRVVLYEEDPADPAGKRYVGSAVWRTDTVAAGPGQAPDVAVRAEIEIPERKVTMKLSLRRNTDKALPASHTIEIMFALPPDFPHGGISNIPGILMKQAEQTRGIPLAGLAVKVTTGFFLIGLSAVEADMQRNIQLLKERSWFDVPVVYNDGRRAIMAVEKGTPGDRAFADAFAAWGQ